MASLVRENEVKVNLRSPKGQDIARFLADLSITKGLSYNIILLHRSAISTFCAGGPPLNSSTDFLVRRLSKRCWSLGLEISNPLSGTHGLFSTGSIKLQLTYLSLRLPQMDSSLTPLSFWSSNSQSYTLKDLKRLLRDSRKWNNHVPNLWVSGRLMIFQAMWLENFQAPEYLVMPNNMGENNAWKIQEEKKRAQGQYLPLRTFGSW